MDRLLTDKSTFCCTVSDKSELLKCSAAQQSAAGLAIAGLKLVRHDAEQLKHTRKCRIALSAHRCKQTQCAKQKPHGAELP